MESRNLVIFKLNYAGKYEEMQYSGDNPLELFSVVSILAVYVVRSKIMYMWMGSKASRSLKNYIGHFRAEFQNAYPDYRVVRNITIECAKEPEDFFGTTRLAKADLHGHIEYQEKKLLPVISEINSLKAEQDDLFEAQEYEKSIEISKKIKALAEEIDDKYLVQDQEEFITEAQNRAIYKSFMQETNSFIVETRQKVETANVPKDIISLHARMEEFKKKYGRTVDFSKVPEVKELIDREDTKWKGYLERQEQIIAELKQLEQEIKPEIEARNTVKARELLTNAKQRLENIYDEDTFNAWDQIEEKFTELSEGVKKKIEALETKIQSNLEERHLEAVINYSEKLIQLAQEHDKKEIEGKYAQVLEKARIELEALKAAQMKEQEELQGKAKELETIIAREEGVLPLIDEFSVNDLIGDLSGDLSEMLNQIGGLLKDHRVEIKTKISNKSVLRSASGEVLELEKSTEVKKTGDEAKGNLFNVQSGLENPFDDMIEEAIITDLIPYNFEITNIQLNNKPVEKLPDKILTKDGIELKWQLYNIPAKEHVEINYDLRRRVSRTVIFMFEGKLKIIKTHSKISELQLEGLYEAKLPFTNNFNSNIEGLVVEDIIPLYYLNYIKEPTTLLPDKVSDSKTGELLKWKVGTLEPKTMNYHYKLLEMFKLEEIKITISELNNKGKKCLDKGDFSAFYAINDEIIQKLEEYY